MSRARSRGSWISGLTVSERTLRNRMPSCPSGCPVMLIRACKRLSCRIFESGSGISNAAWTIFSKKCLSDGYFSASNRSASSRSNTSKYATLGNRPTDFTNLNIDRVCSGVRRSISSMMTRYFFECFRSKSDSCLCSSSEVRSVLIASASEDDASEAILPQIPKVNRSAIPDISGPAPNSFLPRDKISFLPVRESCPPKPA